MSADTAREKIRELVERYNQLVKDGKTQKFSEPDVGSKFILPFMEALGWDIKNIDEVKEQRRTLTGPADYSLNINGQPKLVVEIKRFDENLDTVRTVRGREESYAEQAIRYAWHLKVDWVVLSNFVETRLYYSHVIKPHDGLIFEFKHNEYLANFEKLWILSRESVVAGILDTYEKRRMRMEIDEQILGDLFVCRKTLVDSISKNNPQLGKGEIRESVQKILDRIIVIRVAEDRGIIGSDSLWKELDSWKTRGLPTPFMRSLKSLFRDFDDVYNSKLFEKHACEDLKMDNDALEKVISTLYNYNFDLISADVLGAIYEDYIGHILKEAEKGIDIVTDYGTRKEAGIYYTPTHVVDYIVRSALLPFLKDKKPEEVSQLRVLDPACGSGSFLIKTFDTLKKCYESYNLNQKNRTDAPADLTRFAALIPDVEKRILAENIFGVDLDPQAAEIAAVNLMLKTLKRGERLPLILGDNIKCGNSLISGTEEELKKYFGEKWNEEKPFDWQKEFAEILKAGGFDVVIGNPPHGAKLSEEERDFFLEKYQVAKGYKNTASLFIERSVQLLKEGGIVGLVIPKSLTFSQKWNVTRKYILQNLKLLEIADISKAFPGVLLEQIILLCRKKTGKTDSYLGTRLFWAKKPETCEVPMSLCMELDTFPIHVDPMSLAIYKKVMKKSRLLREMSKTSRGLPFQSKASNQKIPGSEALLRGDNIRPFYSVAPSLYITKNYLEENREKVEALKKPKIVSQRIVAHVLNPVDHIIIMSTLDEEGLLDVDTVENTIVTNTNYDAKYVLAFLNSKFVSWFAYTFIFNKAVRTMDFDDYYVGKIPIFPANKDEQKSVAELVERLLKLTRHFVESKAEFVEYVNKYPRLDDVKLEAYYRNLPAKDKQVLIQSNLKGTIKNVSVQKNGDWLGFKIDYSTDKEDHLEVEVLKLKIGDEALAGFIAQSVLNSKKHLAKGNILEKLLQFPIPRFSKDEQKNLQVIKEIMNEYQKESSKRAQLDREISDLEIAINQKIYQFYDLGEDEIEFIESSFGKESVILKMLK
jgi:type I restriction-modification system DNA methylase subunit